MERETRQLIGFAMSIIINGVSANSIIQINPLLMALGTIAYILSVIAIVGFGTLLLENKGYLTIHTK